MPTVQPDNLSASSLAPFAPAAVARLASDERDPVVRLSDDLTEEPRYLIYSITKTMIAAILLRLQEVARIHLDAPLSDWYPDLPRASDISLRMMLRHTAGIPDYGAIEDYRTDLARDPHTPWSVATYIERTAAKVSLFEPGTEFSYSNPAYMLLRLIAEEVTAMSFGELVDHFLAEPLGLERTSVAGDLDDLAGLMPSTSKQITEGEEPLDVRDHYHPGWVSHGVVVATPSDVTRFYRALFTGELLTASSIAEMLDPIDVGSAPSQWSRPQYGLGIMIDRGFPDGGMFGHGGEGPGYSTFAMWMPERQEAICVVTGLEGRGEDLMRSLHPPEGRSPSRTA